MKPTHVECSWTCQVKHQFVIRFRISQPADLPHRSASRLTYHIGWLWIIQSIFARKWATGAHLNEYSILEINSPRIEMSMACSFKLSKSCLLLHKQHIFLYLKSQWKKYFQVKINFKFIINVLNNRSWQTFSRSVQIIFLKALKTALLRITIRSGINFQPDEKMIARSAPLASSRRQQNHSQWEWSPLRTNEAVPCSYSTGHVVGHFCWPRPYSNRLSVDCKWKVQF